jgi:hypothetical protein
MTNIVYISRCQHVVLFPLNLNERNTQIYLFPPFLHFTDLVERSNFLSERISTSPATILISWLGSQIRPNPDFAMHPISATSHLSDSFFWIFALLAYEYNIAAYEPHEGAASAIPRQLAC